jgi:hypothetical protein
MDEQEFFSSNRFRPLRQGDLEDFQRVLILGARLWGDIQYLERQLLAPSPEIPPGAGLQELLKLAQWAKMSLDLDDRATWLQISKGTVIVAGDRRFSIHEARYEIVRRAIASIEPDKPSIY